MDLATTHGIRILPFSSQQQRQITDRYGCYSALDLPAGTYRGVEGAVPTISVWNVIICNADLPEDLVSDLARTLFENIDYMQKIHPYARFTTPENTVDHAPIPLHPGTVRYLRERDITVPEGLIHAATPGE